MTEKPDAELAMFHFSLIIVSRNLYILKYEEIKKIISDYFRTYKTLFLAVSLT